MGSHDNTMYDGDNGNCSQQSMATLATVHKRQAFHNKIDVFQLGATQIPKKEAHTNGRTSVHITEIHRSTDTSGKAGLAIKRCRCDSKPFLRYS